MSAKKGLQVDKTGTSVSLTDEEFKDYLHDQIGRLVREKTGVAISRAQARSIFNLATEVVFRRVVEAGYFRFPGGYGSFKLVQLRENAAVRTMPGGDKVKPKNRRYKVKYASGVAVMDMLGVNPHKYVRKTKRPSVLADIAADAL